MLQKYLIILVILSFFPDWGFIYRGFNRPMISLADITVILFIIFWFYYRIRQKNRQLNKSAVRALFIIGSLFITATLGATLHYSQINWMEHFKSSIRLLFWGVFIFCWIDVVRQGDYSLRTEISNRAWRTYINLAIIISILAIFQYIFHDITGIHLKLHPFIDQGWESIGSHYRAMSIYAEPSFFGVILLPPLIGQGEIYLRFNKAYDLIKYLILLMGVAISFSLASFLIFGIWFSIILLRWFRKSFSLFNSHTINKRKLYISLVSLSLIVISGFVFFCWTEPVVSYRVTKEADIVMLDIKGETSILSSGVKRLSSYEGFWAVIKHSPIFGVGFDQREYISSLLGKYFEATTSGIFGFIGTSAGLLGILLIFYFFIFIWNGGDKKNNQESIKIETNSQIALMIAGKSIISVLFLEQLFLYGGILNSDFWLPLAFAFSFIDVR